MIYYIFRLIIFYLRGRLSLIILYFSSLSFNIISRGVSRIFSSEADSIFREKGSNIFIRGKFSALTEKIFYPWGTTHNRGGDYKSFFIRGRNILFKIRGIFIRGICPHSNLIQQRHMPLMPHGSTRL